MAVEVDVVEQLLLHDICISSPSERSVFTPPSGRQLPGDIMDDLVRFRQGGGDGVICARNLVTKVSWVTVKTEPKVACEGRLSVRT